MTTKHDTKQGWCVCGEFHDKRVEMPAPQPERKEVKRAISKPLPASSSPPMTIEDYEKNISAAGRDLGRKGARKGGLARARKLTPERRSEIARNAVQARWEYPYGSPRIH
jgi:hypothetical protein